MVQFTPAAAIPAPFKLYFVGLLGAAQLTRDDWMATDMAVVATLLDDKEISSTIFSPQPFTSYKGCSSDGIFKYGDDHADRLAIPAPNGDHVVINESGTALKDRFIEHVKVTTKKMGPKDCLLIFLAAHVDEDNINVGDVLLNKKELIEAISPATDVFLWSTTRHAGKWLHDAPWLGYAASSATETSESLTGSDSSYYRGVNTMTPLVGVSKVQNDYFPSYSHRTYPENYHPNQASLITTSNELFLPKLDYSSEAVASSTQRALPLPKLTHDMLGRFVLLPCSSRPSLISTNSQASISVNHRGSAAFRERFDTFSFLWPPSVDKDELIELASPFLDCQPAPTASHLVYLREAVWSPLSTKEIEHFFDIFRHRHDCQIRVAEFLKHGSWNSSYIPIWDVFVAPKGSREILEEFIAANEESAKALGQMIEWRCLAGPPMRWLDIRIQLALAWAEAGRPTFSFDELEAIGDRAEELRKENVLLSSSGQSSRPLQVIMDWPELRFAFQDLGILPDRRQSVVHGEHEFADT